MLSCVRTQRIGFIGCPRRTNVALSRARRHMVVVGKVALLNTDHTVWGGVVNTCRENGARVYKSGGFLKHLASVTI